MFISFFQTTAGTNLLNIFAFLSKLHNKRTSPAIRIRYPELSMVLLYNGLCDRQSQPEVFLGIVGGVRPVESFKNPLFILIGNADSCIRYGNDKMFFCMFEGYLNAAALICIADGIVDKNGEKLFNFMLIANTEGK